MPTRQQLADARSVTEVHRRHVKATTAAARRSVKAAEVLLDPEHLRASWPLWAAHVATVTTIGQRLLRDEALAYVERYVTIAAGLRLPLALFDAQLPLTGVVADGRPIATVLSGGLPVTLARIGKGVDPSEAVVMASNAATRLTGTEVMSVGTDSTMQALRAESDLPRSYTDGRYRRVASGNCCVFCAALEANGAIYSADSVDFAAHDRCECSGEPVVDGYGPSAARTRPDVDQSAVDDFWSANNSRRRALRTTG